MQLLHYPVQIETVLYRTATALCALRGMFNASLEPLRFGQTNTAPLKHIQQHIPYGTLSGPTRLVTLR